MKYIQIPVKLLEVGKPLPVDLFNEDGQLLLRKGLPVESTYHRDKLYSFKASASPADASAWQRAYERTVHSLLSTGADLQQIADARMPSEIRTSDYQVAHQLDGGWLDLQVILRGILYQGGLAINPLPRLYGIRDKVKAMVQTDADDSLFSLFQALRDSSLGYCPTHALLCAVLCELTAVKLGMSLEQRDSLMLAALTMNIGMAREQDVMARQYEPLSAAQRDLITQHALEGADMLAGMGVDDQCQLDIVRWHHHWDHPDGFPANQACRRLLHLADAFVARTAARKTRASLPPVVAVKSMVLGAVGGALGVGSAMAQAVGFYPPGSYVRLQGGEVAVSVQRGERANTPWVICIVDRNEMPVTSYICRNTAEPAYAIRTPENAESIKVTVQHDKVLRARSRIQR